MSWLRPPKSSASVWRPAAPSKTYSFVTASHGSSRTARLISSLARVNAFSFSSSARRALSHSSCETTRCCMNDLLRSDYGTRVAPECEQEGPMPRGDKSKYTNKEKRQEQHIEKG